MYDEGVRRPDPETMRSTIWLLGLLVCSAGCPERTSSAGSGEASPPAAVASTPHEENSSNAGETKPASSTESPVRTNDSDVGSVQVSPTEPEPVVAPDGTVALPCELSLPDMVCIPGGPTIRGRDEGPPNTRPAATVWVQTYYLDRYEVTVAEYEACAKAGDCPRSGPRYTDFDHPRMPIQGVSWHDAVRYCEVQGKQLPSEAQWEKAARGPEGELWPWGDEPATCERAIIKDARGRSCGLKKAISKPETGRPWDVGSRPPGPHGLYDMIGNSWEWVADWYTRSYEDCGEACLGIDPRGPCDGADECPGYRHKIVRGGSWYWDESRATAAYRRAHVPSNRPFHHFGFRCAATLEQAEALAETRPRDQDLDPSSD